jgi:isopenicillin N synthase-like dioxygenase
MFSELQDDISARSGLEQLRKFQMENFFLPDNIHLTDSFFNLPEDQKKKILEHELSHLAQYRLVELSPAERRFLEIFPKTRSGFIMLNALKPDERLIQGQQPISKKEKSDFNRLIKEINKINPKLVDTSDELIKERTFRLSKSDKPPLKEAPDKWIE